MRRSVFRCRMRRCLFSVIFISTFLFLLLLKIIGNGKFDAENHHVNFNAKAKLHEKAHEMPLPSSSAKLKEHATPADSDNAERNLTETIEKWLEEDFELTSIYKNRTLKDFQPDFGGHPIANLLVTTFRSGSSFLGEILNQSPGTFYIFEPFQVYKTYSLECPVSAETNMTPILRDMLKCKLNCLQRKKTPLPIPEAKKQEKSKIPQGLLSYCELNYQSPVLRFRDPNLKKFCSDKKYIEKVCSKFPIQAMKLVQVSLKQVSGILEEENPNVQILYLIRDPRGTMLSRQKYYEPKPILREDWTLPVLCSGLLEDYHVAMTLIKKHPEKFKVIRFESLAKDPWRMTEKVYEYFHLPFGFDVQLFLKTHTEKSIDDKRWSKLDRVHSTYKNSTTVPDAWIREAKIKTKTGEKTDNFQRIVTHVQKECGEAMKLWGYKIAKTVDELNENFNPIEKTDFDNALL